MTIFDANAKKKQGSQKRLVHMGNREGHRREYQDLFVRVFGLEPSIGRVGPRNITSLVKAQALFFGTLDDDYAGFLLVSLLRAVLGRRTVGLLLRPQTCFLASGLRYKAKRHVFQLLKSLKPISVFTIVPFAIAPEYARIADAGLVDPQFWDKTDEDDAIDPAFMSAIHTRAQGRRILGFVGTANKTKGVSFLSEIVAAPDWSTETLFAMVAGRVPEDVDREARELHMRGAMVVPRFISDEECNTIYAAADFIWACYRPDHDQASGVFGRSIQAGKTPIVRKGSLIERFAQLYGLPFVALEYGEPQKAIHLLSGKLDLEPRDVPALVRDWRYDFINGVNRAL